MDGDKSRPRRTRVMVWSAVGLLVVAGAIAGVLVARNAGGNGKKKSDKDAPLAAPVELTEVRRGSLATWLQTTTTLEARNSATVIARAPGELVQLAAEEGEWVEKGAVLARLEDTEARLAVERAEVALETAERESERGEKMGAQGFLSDQQLDDLKLKLRTARLQLEQARHDLTETRLVAPFSGRVSDRLVNLGETVVAGKECFRLVDFDPILARVYFPERELPRLRIGSPAMVELDAHPGQSFDARVALVNPVVDRSTGTFKVTLEVRDPQNRLRPGSFARVRLRTGSYDDAVLLPRRAMVVEDGDDYVFVAKGDTVSRVAVEVGAITGDTAQILAGLVAGDSVVTIGQGGLKQGSRIKPVRL